MTKLIIFDFDGVLAIPWTYPEEHYPQIPQIIKDNSEHLLCVASFNPRAYTAIKAWNLDHHFTAMRCGSNNIWNHDNVDEYKEEYSYNMSKVQQIIDIIDNEVSKSGKSYDKIIFYDDNLDNINEVKRKLPHINAVLIDEDFGLSF